MPLNEYEFPTAKLANVQSQLERLVAKNYYLHSSARLGCGPSPHIARQMHLLMRPQPL